jgi:hypothetical protein
MERLLRVLQGLPACARSNQVYCLSHGFFDLIAIHHVRKKISIIKAGQDLTCLRQITEPWKTKASSNQVYCPFSWIL